MKKNIFLYLFILAVLAIVYQQVLFKNERKEEVIKVNEDALIKRTIHYQDTIAQLRDENLDLSYFKLEYNGDALNYFELLGYDTEKLIPIVKDALLDTNDYKKEHPLIPFESMTDGKVIINRVEMINHKWIITDFNDGPYWGELLLKYFINKDGTYEFEYVDAFIYPLNR